jgi:hypothetical protein
MAYNILRGTIEFSDTTTGSIESMVDDWSIQTITGVKTFSSTLSASVFWDTTSDSQITAPAITAITNDASSRLVVSDGDGTVTAYSTLTFSESTLTASYFSGSAVGLIDIPVDRFNGNISASAIYYGNGLTASSEQLTVRGGDGITVDASGVAVTVGVNEGLTISASALTIDPTNIVDVTSGGQNLADADVLIVEDVSHGLRKTTLTNLYSNYIAAKIPSAAITSYTNSTNNRLITSVDSTTVNSEANLTFDGATLVVAGDVSGSGNASLNRLSIGEDTTSTRLYVKAEADNELVAIFKSPSNDTILAITGSGQVTIGGAYLTGSFNITGSDDEILFAAKSDTIDPVMVVRGDGNVGIGTVAPAYNLHVNGASATIATIDAGAGSDAFLRFATNGVEKSSIKQGSGGNLVITNETADKDITFSVKDSATIREGLRLNGDVAEVVINEGSDSLVNFRVETDNKTHMLYVDGANDTVGINNSTPKTALDVHHDPTSLSNETGGGDVVTFGSGTLVAGVLYYLHTDGTWTATDADAAATGADQLLGIALGTTASAGVLLRGFFDATAGLTGFSAGKAVYMGTTAGAMDTTAPSGTGDIVRIMGYCTTTANIIYFCPSNNWIELA